MEKCMLYPCIPFNNLRLLNLSIIHTYRQPQIVFKHFKGYYMKINYKEQCAICGKICDIKNHIKEHNIQSKDYYDKYIKLLDEGICKTCGNVTKFISMNCGYRIYCSNKCHGQDIESQKLHSQQLKNKSKEEKILIRNKQIATWNKTMGENWGKIMSQHACESYDKKHLDKNGNPITVGGPFASKEVRKKCEKAWGGVSSPTCNQEIKDKLSTSISTIWNNNEYRDEFEHKTLEKINKINKNIIGYSKGIFTYKCPICNEIFKLNKQFVYRRVKWNINLCPFCVPRTGISILEKNLVNYIKEIYTDEIIENDKSIISPKELDIVLPKLKLAFEFDGTYWHMDSRVYDSTDFNIRKNCTAKEIWEYDNQKIILCKEKGYKLFRIKELDWLNDNINIKKYVKDIIDSEVINA